MCLCTFEDLVVLSTHDLILDGSTGKDPPAAQETQEAQVQSLSQEDPLAKKMATAPVSFPENPMDRRAWWATVQKGCRVRPSEQLNTHTCRGSEHMARLPRFLQLNLSQ